ncbi:unnamed protein product [Didymodactylos carnosus]|uniref:N-acetyltransferase domain-containing protein n=1 Tax=Didymodactylos carnosus TaxID=1234261 RepID=A0A815H6B8_9BILA|nr:unnamed protein product [Didymodactylos carnosus]CAF4213576.1 unnamed protein product [Didymodactylos carnosus]
MNSTLSGPIANTAGVPQGRQTKKLTVELGYIIEKCELNDFIIEFSFASHDCIDDICNVVNWAFRGKPSSTNQLEIYCGWICEEHLVSGKRILPHQLKKYIDRMEQNKHNPDEVIIVVKLINKDLADKKQIVGSIQISLYDSTLQPLEEKENGIAVEFGLVAVDPDYQSKGIGTLMYGVAVVRKT